MAKTRVFVVSTLMHGVFVFERAGDAEYFCEAIPRREQRLTEVFEAYLYDGNSEAIQDLKVLETAEKEPQLEEAGVK